MLPIGPLMIEHRLIERMIRLMARELDRQEEQRAVNPRFIETACTFIRAYADRCHHGKEEDILFRELKEKTISAEHRETMEALIEDHRWGRETTGRLVAANQRYEGGDESALPEIVNTLRALIEFYPQHIEREDRHFFIPVMEYFTDPEKDDMLREGYEFDSQLLHREYEQRVSDEEQS